MPVVVVLVELEPPSGWIVGVEPTEFGGWLDLMAKVEEQLNAAPARPDSA
jgi:hypothetical protein